MADPDSVTPAIMELREYLMEYFKGDCVQRVTSNGNVVGVAHHVGPRQYGYQRRALQDADGQLVHFGSMPLFIVSKRPPTLQVLDCPMERGVNIQAGIRSFMKHYLGGVTVTDGQPDVPQPQPRTPRQIMEQYITISNNVYGSRPLNITVDELPF